MDDGNICIFFSENLTLWKSLIYHLFLTFGEYAGPWSERGDPIPESTEFGGFPVVFVSEFKVLAARWLPPRFTITPLAENFVAVSY